MAKANRTSAKRPASRRRDLGIMKFLTGVLAGVTLTLVCLAGYFYFGNPPVAVSDKASLWEPLVSRVPLKARAKADAKPAPFAASEDVFEAAAHTYHVQCAQCHGAPGHESVLGRGMLPRAMQFFSPRDRRATAVQAPGELYWKTAFGVRRSGMPAYNRMLSDTQLWQLSLLLHSAADDLPDPVRAILTEGVPRPQPTVVQP